MNPSALSRRASWSAGQPISELMHMALSRPEIISLAAGFVDQKSLPVEATRAAAAELLSEAAAGQAALQYGTTAGYPRLREQLLERLWEADGRMANRPEIRQVVVTAGSNELLHLIGDTLLDPGDIVITAAPTYFVFLGMIANLGGRCVGVPIDGEGLLPEALEETLLRLQRAGELPRVKAIYVTTYFDNPATVTLSAQRRPQLVEIARRWSGIAKRKIYLIEDAAYRELRYEGGDIPSLRAFDGDGEMVIHTATFSKSFSPGIRVGWGVLPGELVEPLLAQKGNIDFGAPNFAQHLMSTVLGGGLFEAHVERLREAYRIKRDAMLSAAERFLRGIPGTSWRRPEGGLYVWLRTPESVDTGLSGALFQRALDRGVLYVPGRFCYPAGDEGGPNHEIRLSFGVQPPERIERGVELLAEALRSVMDE